MPEELSKYIHDFLRGGTEKEKRLRIYRAKCKWLNNNIKKGFQVGQQFHSHHWIDDKELLVTILKVGKMITYEYDGKIERRKPIYKEPHISSFDGNHIKIKEDWELNINKRVGILMRDIYAR